MCVYIYVCIPFQIFPLISYYIILNIVLCAIQYVFVVLIYSVLLNNFTVRSFLYITIL